MFKLTNFALFALCGVIFANFVILLVTISDALPIQFWLSNCETYNERVVYAINHRCFFAPIECDDEQKVQFTDDAGSDFLIQILDEDDVEIFSTYFVKEDLANQSVYTYTFTPSDLGICDQKIRVKIIEDASPDSEVASSDLLDVKTEHKGTQLITYTNNRDYAGLVYADQSPDVDFSLRLFGAFYHERSPEEDKALPLSNSVIINTSGMIKNQRRLDVWPAPDYFHKKIQLALKHQTVSIDNLLWIREEAYDRIQPENKRWPLKQATVWLTERNFVVRNVI